MSDNLTASLSVGVIYSGDGSGLTVEQEEQLNKIPMIEQSIEEITNDLNTKANTSDIPTNTSELYNDSGFLTSIPSEYVTETEMNEAIANVSSGGSVDLSGYATKDELNTKANISDVPTAIETYVTTHRDELKGDTGAAGRDGTNAVNPNFTIGTVTTLEPNESPTVTLSGTYPNLVLNFGIPRGAGQTVDTTEYMYYGRLSIEDVGGRVIPYNNITENMILKGVTDGKLTKSIPHTLKKESLGLASTTAVGDYQIVIVPASKNYTVTKDNGLGGKMEFDEETSGANGIDIIINTIACKLYGEILIAQGEKFIYVD